MTVETVSDAPLLGKQPWTGGRTRARRSILKDVWKNRFYYFLALPGLIYFLIFHYLPMFGIVVAFKDITPFSVWMGSCTSHLSDSIISSVFSSPTILRMS